MKRLSLLATVLLLSALLGLPALAANSGEKQPLKSLPEQTQADDVAQDVHESEAFKRQQAYMKKREEMRQRRDAATEVRERNLQSNNPGNTGL